MKPKRTILCVDDNEQSLSIRKVLLETRGYRVIASTRGEVPWGGFRGGGVALLFPVFVLPGLDAPRLFDEEKRFSPQTPAILVSGKVKMFDRDTRADCF